MSQLVGFLLLLPIAALCRTAPQISILLHLTLFLGKLISECLFVNIKALTLLLQLLHLSGQFKLLLGHILHVNLDTVGFRVYLLFLSLQLTQRVVKLLIHISNTVPFCFNLRLFMVQSLTFLVNMVNLLTHHLNFVLSFKA